MAVEWTVTIEGRSEFSDVCRREVQINKSWERLFDGEHDAVSASCEGAC
jgi:hypothetical protein